MVSPCCVLLLTHKTRDSSFCCIFLSSPSKLLIAVLQIRFQEHDPVRSTFANPLPCSKCISNDCNIELEIDQCEYFLRVRVSLVLISHYRRIDISTFFAVQILIDLVTELMCFPSRSFFLQNKYINRFICR